MRITPFAMVTCGYILGCLIKCKTIEKKFLSVFLYHVIISLSVDFGYALQIGSYKFMHTGITSFVLFGLGVIYFFKKRPIPQKLEKWAFFLLASTILSAVLYAIFPYNKPIITFLAGWDKMAQGQYDRELLTKVGLSFVMSVFAIVRYLTILVVAKRVMVDGGKTRYVVDTVSTFLIAIVFYGIVEFIFKNAFKIDVLTNFLIPVFGKSEGGATHLVDRNGIIPLQGLTTEPSYYSFRLFFAGIFFLQRIRLSTEKTEKGIFIGAFVCALALLLVSMSFFALFFIGALFMMWCLNATTKKFLFRIGVGGGVAIVALLIISIPGVAIFQYFIERIRRLMQAIVDIFHSSLTASSENVRISSILESFVIFANRPLFGLYWYATDAHSLIVPILANCGCVGFVCWLVFNKYFTDFFGTRNVWRSLVILALLCITGSFGYILNAALPICVLACNITDRLPWARKPKLGESLKTVAGSIFIGDRCTYIAKDEGERL